LSPHTSRVISKLVLEYFDPEYIAVVEGGKVESQALLAQKWDYIFFTGSTDIGRQVMEASAKHLTPVTLELGGKCPCILDRDIPIEVAARRVAYGKFFNAGQTCVAPDYVLLHKDQKADFVKSLGRAIREFYGDDVSRSPDFARIINGRHFQRLVRLMENSRILIGGDVLEAENYIPPTAVDQVDWEHPSMQEEIFGPILPILEYENLDQAILSVNERPKPLALYFFSKNKQLHKKILHSTSSGGVCINDTLSHVISSALPFGGVGASGIGKYHGKASFDTFSHHKSIMERSLTIDPKDRYAPYKMTLGKAKMIYKFVSGA
jgi:acyl-CoA reductase-like NAD-dependent aldehyde dehydrogenase